MPPRKKTYAPADLTKVRRYPITKRSNKTEVKAFGKPVKKLSGDDFFSSLPAFLKAADFNRFIELVTRARKNNKPFHLLLGAHTIKVGLSPIFIDLMKSGIVSGLSFNGAGLIHDLELAFWGGTSEDVQAGLTDGSFGMVRETGEMYRKIVDLAIEQNIGLGAAGGKFINREKAKNRHLSVFGTADDLGLPITVHVGIGTDTIAQHPNFDASGVGQASYNDFKLLASVCADINRGGVVANIGSAVILPEVFLKALTVARNLHKGKNRLTTANFDMIIHYRPMVNIVTRPTFNAGEGFNFVGHHEIMIPLLAWGLKKKQRS
jgi:hypothetical protein